MMKAIWLLFFVLIINYSLAQEVSDSSKILFELYDNTIKSGVETTESYYNRGVLNRDLGNDKAAMLDFSKAILIADVSPSLYTSFVNRGNLFQKQEKFNAAETDFLSAIKVEESNPIAWNNLGYLFFLRDDKSSQAEKHYLTALSLDKHHIIAYINLQQLYLKQKQYQKALDIMDALVDVQPDDPKSYVSRADTYQYIGRLSEALNDWNNAVEKSGNDSKFIGERSKFKDDILNDDLGAIQDAKLAISKDPSNANFYYLLARPYYDLQEFSEVVTNCEKALELNPNHYDALVMKANVLDMYGGNQEAISLYEKAIKLKPSEFDAYDQLSIAYNAQKKYDLSLKTLEEYENQKDVNPEVFVSKAKLNFSTGEFENAVEDLINYMNKDGKEEALANHFLGLLMDTLKQKEKSCDYFKKAFDLGFMESVPHLIHSCPGTLDQNFVNQVMLSTEMMELEKLRQFEKAILKCDELIKIAPDTALYYYNRGKQYRYLEKHELAIKDYKKAISLDENQGPFWVSLAISHQYLGQTKEAIEVYKKCIEKVPNYSMAYVNFAGIQLKEEKPDEAIKLLQKAIQYDPKYAKAYSWLGESYVLKEQMEEACKFFKKADSLGFSEAFAKRIRYCPK